MVSLKIEFPFIQLVNLDDTTYSHFQVYDLENLVKNKLHTFMEISEETADEILCLSM
jgi:hypothetical protein